MKQKPTKFNKDQNITEVLDFMETQEKIRINPQTSDEAMKKMMNESHQRDEFNLGTEVTFKIKGF